MNGSVGKVLAGMRTCICNLSIGDGAETTGPYSSLISNSSQLVNSQKIRCQLMREKPGINLGLYMYMYMYI